MPMKAMGSSGNGYGHGLMGGRASADKRAPAEPMALPPPPSPAPPAPPPHARRRPAHNEVMTGKDENIDRESKKGDAAATRAAATWAVTAGQTTSVGATAPLVEAIRAALAAGRASCLAASAGAPIKVRLTIDAHGRIVRVELVAGDRNAESCLRAALVGLSSATAAKGAPTGTIEITLRTR
jgi:hypothetical protein